MTLPFPALDAHAHDPGSRGPLGGSVALVMTNSVGEYRRRQETGGVIGLGCHPADPLAVASFSAKAFLEAMADAPFIGEVGLDRRSPVPLDEQRRVLDAILVTRSQSPRVVSVHSVGACAAVLAAIAAQPAPGVILHWWQGTASETRRALTLGCVISICPRQLGRLDLQRLPRDRVLVESDYPFGGKTAAPGDVGVVEAALGHTWSCDVGSVRAQLWATFAGLVQTTESESLYPGLVQLLLQRASRAV